MKSRSTPDTLFAVVALFFVTLSMLFLLLTLGSVLLDGWPRLDIGFLTGYPSRVATRAGLLPALVGSLALGVLVIVIAVPVGVASAIYLEEYAPRNWATKFIEFNMANLAAVPSIIFGLLGLQLFARYLGLGRGLLAGALTLCMLVLPVIIISSREAIRAVPRSIRDSSLALGASNLQTVWHQVLPVAFPGILTGSILALSRAIGETAPLVALGALTYVPFLPSGLLSEFTALPIQIFNWISRPQEAFHVNAAAGIAVLLVLLLTLNSAAIILRARLQRKLTL